MAPCRRHVPPSHRGRSTHARDDRRATTSATSVPSDTQTPIQNEIGEYHTRTSDSPGDTAKPRNTAFTFIGFTRLPLMETFHPGQNGMLLTTSDRCAALARSRYSVAEAEVIFVVAAPPKFASSANAVLAQSRCWRMCG